MRAQSHSPVPHLLLVIVTVSLGFQSDRSVASADPNLDPAARLAPVSGVGKVRWGYYVPYYPSSRISLEAHIGDLDVVSPAWFRLETNGSVVESSNDDRATIARIVRQRGARLIPLVANGPRNAAFHTLLSDPVLRPRSIANLLRLVQQQGYDGIHIDFEAVE